MYNGLGSVLLTWLIPLVLLALILLAVYRIVQNNQAARNNQEPIKNNALKILDERYARGEIDEAEYEKIKQNLRER